MISSSRSLATSAPVAYNSAKTSALLCWTAFRITPLCTQSPSAGSADSLPGSPTSRRSTPELAPFGENDGLS